MPSELESFLKRNSVVPAEALPLVHSTRSYALRAIIKANSIDPQLCDTFLKEKLNYFFVGRPSYKYDTDSASADHWELPTCFIFEFGQIGKFKRVFPFDSGAFRGKRYPDYISMMPWQEFETQGQDIPERIIGSFFGSAKKYFLLDAKSKDVFEQEFSVTPVDAEVSALLRLAAEKTAEKFDDRRFAIEVQIGEPVNLEVSKPIAVVIPEQYLDVKYIRETIQDKWKAEAITYPMFSLSVSAYHALIYREVLDFYKRKGLL